MGKEQPIPLGKNGQIEQLPVNPNPGGPSQSQEPPEVNRGDRRVLYRRKNFYIKKTFQAKFILKFCAVLLLGGLITTGLTLYNTQDSVTSNFVNSRLSIDMTSQAIMPSVIYTNIITTGITLIIAILVTLLVSHKIAGPMFRFEKDLERVARGDLKFKFHLRDGDQLADVVSSLNLMVDNLNNSLGIIKADTDKMAEVAEQEGVSDELFDAIKQVQHGINTRFVLK